MQKGAYTACMSIWQKSACWKIENNKDKAFLLKHTKHGATTKKI